MSANNNSKGIILIITAMTFFSMQDALIKFIFEKAALYEIFFGRYLVAAILLFCYIKFRGQKVSLKTYYPFLTFVRVILHFLAFSAFFISLTYMPLATANALFFSCPFFVSIFAKFFLKEFIGIRRWSAIVFGFIGVFLILLMLGTFIVVTTLLTMTEKRLTSDLSPYYIGTYCTLVIGFSFLLNILMVSGMIPVVGLPLPFFTKGGSSLLCFSIMLGLIFTSRGFLK